MMATEPQPKHPETAALVRRCYDATGCKTHSEFVALTGGAISLRTFRYWLAGDRPADPLAQLVLRGLADGWRPPLGGTRDALGA